MKTPIVRSRLVPKFIALALFTAAFAGQAVAADCERDRQPAPAQTVRFADLDLATPKGIQTLYRRIDRAAWKVCRQMFPHANGPSAIQLGRCRRELLEIAVLDVDKPALTAMLKGRRATSAALLAGRKASVSAHC